MKAQKQKVIQSPETITIVRSGVEGNPRNRILIVTPTLGIVRMEWALARFGQAIPCNWSASYATLGIGTQVPMHYLVADAQNLGCQEVVEKGFEWLLLWEDDVIAPPDALLRFNIYMRKADIPVVSGLYFIKSPLTEPVLYRGLGNGAFTDFKLGDMVWADGVPTGFLLIHNSVIKLMWNESQEYQVLGGKTVRKVFETPAKVMYDVNTRTFSCGQGTSDLNWCHRVIREKVLERSGWGKIAKKKYPFLCDTNIFCQHIDLSTGRVYPGGQRPIKGEINEQKK